MSHSDIKYSDIYSELFRYISDIKLVPIICQRPPNVHSKYIILSVFFRDCLKSLYGQLGIHYCWARSRTRGIGYRLVTNCSCSRFNNNDCIAIVMMSLSSPHHQKSFNSISIFPRYMYNRECFECQQTERFSTLHSLIWNWYQFSNFFNWIIWLFNWRSGPAFQCWGGYIKRFI